MVRDRTAFPYSEFLAVLTGARRRVATQADAEF